MIDTVAKRNSAIATRRLPWFRRFAPIPSGSVDQGDRQQLGFVYRGIDAGSPIPVPEKLCFTSEALKVPSFSSEALSIPSFSDETFEVCE